MCVGCIASFSPITSTSTSARNRGVLVTSAARSWLNGMSLPSVLLSQEHSYHPYSLLFRHSFISRAAIELAILAQPCKLLLSTTLAPDAISVTSPASIAGVDPDLRWPKNSTGTYSHEYNEHIRHRIYLNIDSSAYACCACVCVCFAGCIVKQVH